MAATNFASLAGIGAAVPPAINAVMVVLVLADDTWVKVADSSNRAYKIMFPSQTFDYWLSFDAAQTPPAAFMVAANTGPFILEAPAQTAPMPSSIFMRQHSGSSQTLVAMEFDHS